ncbi:maleylpyruvate isomerase family mycothiol-dependent enzyme [Kitasatospora sp. NPDC004240]
MNRTDYAVVLRRESARLAEAATGNFSLRVPSCPDWTVADLVWHVTEVQEFWAGVASGAITDPQTQYTSPERPADERLLDRYREAGERLATTLEALDPELPRWTWSDRKDAGFIQRRMAHEAAVHRWDAQNAIGGAESFDHALAADGIDELLAHFLPAEIPAEISADLPEAGLHLHATDGPAGPGEWSLRAVDGRWQIGHDHTKGAAAVRGTASDLLLLLWGRRTAEDLETFGDPTALKAYLAVLRRD